MGSAMVAMQFIAHRHETPGVYKQKEFFYVHRRPICQRVDAVSKVTGEALFPGDINKPDQAYMKILFAGRAHAIIRRIDTSRARSAGGGDRRLYRQGCAGQRIWIDHA